MSARRAVVAVLALAGVLVALELRVVLRAKAPHRHREGGPASSVTASSRASTPPAAPAPAANESDAATALRDLHFSWSSSPSGLGRLARAEGNAEGPAAFAAHAEGDALIVDGVNGRLVLVSTTGDLRTVPAPLTAIQDATALPGRGFALLDRLVDRAVVLVDGDGKTFAKVPLPPRAGDPGLVTGVFASGDLVCVEREHGACVPIATVKGEPPPSERELPGRLASDGKSVLHAGIVAPGSARVSVARGEASPFVHRYTRELTFAGPVRSLEFLDANAAGELYVGVVLEDSPASVVVLCLAVASGVEIGRQEVPASPLPDEVTRGFAVVPSGGFLALQRTVDGADLRRYRCAP
jgi:hypothetical protein